MNILYDGPFCSYPKGGVVRYFNEISTTLAASNSIYFSRKPKRSFSKNIKLPIFSHFRPHRVSFNFEYFWHKYFINKKIHIIHPTEFELSPTGNYFVEGGSKLIITVHDLIHEKIGAPGKIYSKIQRSAFYRKADGFIFVSKSTQSDFAKFYRELYNSKPSRVILHGCNYTNKKTKYSQRKRQFLFVGARNGYKNFHSALSAFKKIVSLGTDSTLVVAGARPTKEEIILTSPFESNVKWVESPSDEDLQNLYSESLSLLYVSEYEGFGMPLLEAMSRGCIPIAGNHSSIPEVLGNSGIIVNVNNPDEIASQMMKIITSKDYSTSKVNKGFSTVNNFSWKKTAKQTLEFYIHVDE